MRIYPDKISDKTCLIFDYGLFVSLAERLVGSFGRVLYYCPWKKAHPFLKDCSPGRGIPGVEPVLNFFDHVNETDLFIFPDTLDGDIQVHLRSIGKRVWGSGKAEEIELNRWEFKKHLAKLGLPVSVTKRVIGIEKLRELLKKEQDKFIKVSLWRGDLETFYHKDYAASLPWIDEKAHRLGPLAKGIEFLVETPIPGVEIGYDGFNIDGQFPDNAAYGYEIKDAAYLGKTIKYDSLPAAILTINEALSPLLKKYQYRNMFSTEVRVSKDRKPYLIDPCPRFGCPPGELYIEMVTNLPELMWYGGNGELIEPIYAGSYSAEIMLMSEWGKDNFTEVRFPKEIKPFVKLSNYFIVDGATYTAPTGLSTEIGAVIAYGNTEKEAIELVKKRASQIEAYQLQYEIDALDKADETIKEGAKYGINWG